MGLPGQLSVKNNRQSPCAAQFYLRNPNELQHFPRTIVFSENAQSGTLVP